jgi:hypothetical protein
MSKPLISSAESAQAVDTGCGGIQVPLLGPLIALMNDLDHVFALIEKAAYDSPTLFRFIQSPLPAVRK